MNVRGPRVPDFFASQVEVPPSTGGVGTARGAETFSNAEAFSGTFNSPGKNEQLIYSTQSQWRALDVYVFAQANVVGGLGPIPSTSILTMKVYALLNGTRFLAASGRLGNNVAPGPVQRPMWVAAARGQSTKWEITLEHKGAAGAVASFDGQCNVVCVGSNEANEPPEWVGCVRAQPTSISSIVTGQQLATQQFPHVEIVSVEGIISAAVATARYLHVHDNGPIAVAGAVPAFVFPLGNAGGQGGSFKLNFRSVSQEVRIVASSTSSTTTAVNDCSVQAIVR